MLISDEAGRIKYANEAACLAVAGNGTLSDLIGRRIHDVLGRFRAAGDAPHRLLSGDTAWFLTLDSLESLKDARFAAEVGDALAGTLNLRRTLGRIVDLAVPRLAEWATVTLWDHDRIRQVARGAAATGDDRTVLLSRVPDAHRKALRGLIDSTAGQSVVEDAADLLTVGATEEDMEALLSEGALTLATAPLRAHGAAFGLLALGKHGPVDMAGLESLARRGAVALSAARVYEERSTLATTLRSALLPPALPSIEGIRFGAAYRPAQETTEIGGDFYELRPDGKGWTFTLGDVCGKGVEAAVLTGQVRQSIRTVSLINPDPVARLELLNSTLLSTHGTSFVTLVHGVMRPVDGGVKVQLVAGGHPPPFLRRRDGTVEEVEVRGPIVGMLPEVEFHPAELFLVAGETLLCFTDGVPDARGPDGFLGTDRLARILADCAGMPAQAIADRCLQTALEYLDGRPHDDMALLAVQVDPV